MMVFKSHFINATEYQLPTITKQRARHCSVKQHHVSACVNNPDNIIRLDRELKPGRSLPVMPPAQA